MLSQRTPGDVVAEIKMTRASRAAVPFLVLEGIDDYRFWGTRARSDVVRIDAMGRPTVESAIGRLDAQSFVGALGVTDADLDTAEGRTPPSTNIVNTGLHSLESVCFASAAFEKVLSELGDTQRIARFEAGGVSVRDAVIARAHAFGLLRWLNERKQVGVSFLRLPPTRFIDEATWTLDIAGLHAEVCRKGLAQDAATLGQELATLPIVPALLVCQGHDLVDVLAIGLRRVLGVNTRAPSSVDVARLLRAGLDKDEFAITQLAQDVRRWEGRVGYAILP